FPYLLSKRLPSHRCLYRRRPPAKGGGTERSEYGALLHSFFSVACAKIDGRLTPVGAIEEVLAQILGPAPVKRAECSERWGRLPAHGGVHIGSVLPRPDSATSNVQSLRHP